MIKNSYANHKISFSEALKRLEVICSRQEKCTSDILKKLELWDIPESEALKITDALKKNKFLDDMRYAVFFARDKYRINRWGREKIRFALRRKGVESASIENAIIELGENNDHEILKDLLIKKMKVLKPSNSFIMKGKLARFGLQRGFAFDIVNKVLDEIVKD